MSEYDTGNTFEEKKQSCGTCSFFRKFPGGKGPLGKVPDNVGECRCMPPSIAVFHGMKSDVQINPRTGTPVNVDLPTNEPRTLFPHVSDSDWGCAQYQEDYEKLGPEFEI